MERKELAVDYLGMFTLHVFVVVSVLCIFGYLFLVCGVLMHVVGIIMSMIVFSAALLAGIKGGDMKVRSIKIGKSKLPNAIVVSSKEI